MSGFWDSKYRILVKKIQAVSFYVRIPIKKKLGLESHWGILVKKIKLEIFFVRIMAKKW